jgi:DNA repair protein RadC
VFQVVEEGLPWVARPQEDPPEGQAPWIAQLLAGGGDPTPQLERARALLDAFGGLRGLLKVSPEELAAGGLLDEQQVALLIAVQRVAASPHAGGRPVIGSFRALERFLRIEAVGEGVAVTRALLLGDQHCLRADVVLARGGRPLSTDQRQNLIRSCLEHRACAAILARSVHPADRSMVDRAREASVVACSLEMLGMRLLDYVLVSASEILRVRWCQPSAASSLIS